MARELAAAVDCGTVPVSDESNRSELEGRLLVEPEAIRVRFSRISSGEAWDCIWAGGC